MKDKDGFDIRCIDSEWKIVDSRDNKDYVCTRYGNKMLGYHICYCDENCKDYRPVNYDKVHDNH